MDERTAPKVRIKHQFSFSQQTWLATLVLRNKALFTFSMEMFLLTMTQFVCSNIIKNGTRQEKQGKDFAPDDPITGIKVNFNGAINGETLYKHTESTIGLQKALN